MGAARTRGDKQAKGTADTAVHDAPDTTQTPGSTNKPQRSTSGRFLPGNNGNPHPLAGPGVPPRRQNVRWHLARRLESPSDSISPIAFCVGDEIAQGMIEAARTAPPERKVRDGKDLIEATYGSKTVAEVTEVPLTIDQAAERRAQIAREREQLLSGGK